MIDIKTIPKDALLGIDHSALLSAGYSASEVRSAGYSASEVRSAGYSASALLSAGYSASEVRSAGYSASEVRSAGYSASEVRSAGFSASEVRSAGFSASEVRELEKLISKLPKEPKPYTRMLVDIKAGKRKHDQSTFGPDNTVELGDRGVCDTPMCTAGHLKQMAGEVGHKIFRLLDGDFAATGRIIHDAWCPGVPRQNYGAIDQKLAMAYIEWRAAEEAKQ